VRSVASIYARLIGIAVCLYGGWMFLGNLILAMIEGNNYRPGWVLLLVLLAAALGVVGAILFLLSFDGPAKWRTRTRRIVGWSGMIGCLLLPTSISFALLPLVGLGVFTLVMRAAPDTTSEQATQSV